MGTSRAKSDTITLSPFERDVLRQHADRAIVSLCPIVVEAVAQRGPLTPAICTGLQTMLEFSDALGFELRTEPLVLEDHAAKICALLASRALESRDELEQGEVDVWVDVAARLPRKLRQVVDDYNDALEAVGVK